MSRGTSNLTLLLLLVTACPGDDGSPAATATESATDGPCTPGTEACECIEGGQCVTGLVCASNLCVNIDGTEGADESGMKPEDMTSSGPGDETGAPVGSCVDNCGGSDMNGDAWCYCTRACQFAGDCCPDYEQACPGACIYSTQCDGDDVCSAAQECVPAYGHVYEMTVKSWRDYTPNCWDALDCYADVYFRVFYGTQGEIYKSAIHPNTNSTNWNNEPFDVGINATDVMQIVFYDSDDASNDDPTNAVCFGVDVCGPVGVAVLQAGGAIWDDSSDPAADDRFYVEVSFVAK